MSLRFLPSFLSLSRLSRKFAGASVLLVVASLPAAERPNILLILCDDLGFSDLGCYGSEIRTPNLDRLAQQGMRFTQFYNTAVCTTSRAALLTGLYPRQERPPFLRQNMLTLGEAARRAGYATALVGKWHLGSEAPRRPIDRGFDEYYGILSGACDYFNPAQPDPAFYKGGDPRLFFHNTTRLTTFAPGYYTTDAFSDEAIDLIKKYAGEHRPFFLHLCYNAPHFPLQAPAADIARYRGKYEAGYNALRESRFARQATLGLFSTPPVLSGPDTKVGNYRNDYGVPVWADLSPAQRQRESERMEVYAAMVDRLDQGIGRVLHALEANGVAENTIVLFLSDNGGCASLPTAQEFPGYEAYNRDVTVGDPHSYEFVGPSWGWAQNAPFRRHKTWTYEGGITTPMIVRWPHHVTPGSISREVGHVIDLMPTLLDLTGSAYPGQFNGQTLLPLEGHSLLPVFKNQTPLPRGMLAWELYGNRALRDEDWKIVWGAGRRQWELYNLKDDRTETTDLSARYPERTAMMVQAWEFWLRRVEDAPIP